jgi:hypothetical protein
MHQLIPVNLDKTFTWFDFKESLFPPLFRNVNHVSARTTHFVTIAAAHYYSIVDFSRGTALCGRGKIITHFLCASSFIFDVCVRVASRLRSLSHDGSTNF